MFDTACFEALAGESALVRAGLDWAELGDDDRWFLAKVAGGAIRSFTALFGGECAQSEGFGALPCSRFDGTFLDAVANDVVAPLAERGIFVPEEDIADLHGAVLPS